MNGATINGEEKIQTDVVDIPETIRQEALTQFDEIMDHYMFELGNEMTFLTNQKEASTYIYQNFDTLLLDCDGVLYRGTDAVPGVASALQSWMKAGKKLLFVTNNAGSNRKQLGDKLQKVLGVEDLTVDQMVSSSYAAARYLQKSLLENDKDKLKDSSPPNVHVIGTSGLCNELRDSGFRVTSGEETDPAGMSREDLASYSFHEEESDSKKVDAVVVGLDTDFSYRKLCIANVLLQRHPEAVFVATNEDAFDLVGADARHLPGNGALVKAIEHASQRKAVNVGKPSPILAELLREEHGLDLSRTLMVGDRLDTDVRFGKDSGMKSALVMTGCTTADALIGVGVGSTEEPLPHMILPYIGLIGMNEE
jgi:phosphoglycolate/pyridoxal phosphate phosphatase family enzyme